MEEIQNTPIIYVVGPALSGNTTLGRNFQGRGFTWLEMSEIIRDRVKKDPIFREYAENVSAIGILLPDKIMNTLFRDRVRNISTRTIVTGYPITEGQGYFASITLKRKDTILSLSSYKLLVKFVKREHHP